MAPEAPKLAYCASTSLMTCAVVNQPSAHNAGVDPNQTTRRQVAPASTAACAIPTPTPVSAPITTRLLVSVSWTTTLDVAYDQLPHDRFPHTIALRPPPAEFVGERQFEYGLQRLLDGIAAQAPKRRRVRARPTAGPG